VHQLRVINSSNTIGCCIQAFGLYNFVRALGDYKFQKKEKKNISKQAMAAHFDQNRFKFHSLVIKL